MVFEKLGYTLAIENTPIEFEWQEVKKLTRGGGSWRMRLGGDGTGCFLCSLQDGTIEAFQLGRALTQEEIKCALLVAVKDELLTRISHARRPGARRTTITFAQDQPLDVTVEDLRQALRMAVR